MCKFKSGIFKEQSGFNTRRERKSFGLIGESWN